MIADQDPIDQTAKEPLVPDLEASLNHDTSNVKTTWPFSLDNVRQNLAAHPEDVRDLMIDAYLWCIDPAHPVTRHDFAVEVDYSENTIWRIYSGQYRTPKSGATQPIAIDLISAVHQFLARQKKVHTIGQNEFVTTPTSQVIWGALDQARSSDSIVLLEGVSHIGKTWAIQRYKEVQPHAKTFYGVCPAAVGVSGLIRAIAKACAVEAVGTSDQIVDRIKLALAPGTLLILEELHDLAFANRKETFFKGCETIRQIIDASRCGLLISATHLLMAKMKLALAGELQQLLRRSVHRYALPTMPTKADLTAIFAAAGLPFPKQDLLIDLDTHAIAPYGTIRNLAKEDGLKSICERLRIAKESALKAKQKLTWTHFAQAHMKIKLNATASPDWH